MLEVPLENREKSDGTTAGGGVVVVVVVLEDHVDEWIWKCIV